MKRIGTKLLAVASLFSGKRAVPPYDKDKQTKQDNYTQENQTATPGGIALVGDSIVELYPIALFEKSEMLVYNRGISGDTSGHMAARLANNVLTLHPKTVVILIGTNDITYGVPHETILENIQNTIVDCYNHQVKTVVVQSLYPVNAKMSRDAKYMVGKRKNADILALNQKIAALCARQNAVYANIHAALTDADGLFLKDFTYDGLHPSERGYFAIHQALLPYLL